MDDAKAAWVEIIWLVIADDTKIIVYATKVTRLRILEIAPEFREQQRATLVIHNGGEKRGRAHLFHDTSFAL